MKNDLRAKIESDVKGQLRLNRIEVNLNAVDKYYPILLVDVDLLKIPPVPIHAVSINMEVHDLAILEREGNMDYKGNSPTFYSADAMPLGATTWRRGHMGAVGEENMEVVRKTIRGYVDELIKGYLAANPR